MVVSFGFLVSEKRREGRSHQINALGVTIKRWSLMRPRSVPQWTPQVNAGGGGLWK